MKKFTAWICLITIFTTQMFGGFTFAAQEDGFPVRIETGNCTHRCEDDQDCLKETDKKETGDGASTASPSNADQENKESNISTPSDADDEDDEEYFEDEDLINDLERAEDTSDNCVHVHDDNCGYYTYETNFSYEDDLIAVHAVMTSDNSDALPWGARLVAEPIEDEQQLAEINAVVNAHLGEEKSAEEFLVYDVYFEYDGVEYEPENANVNVTMRYKTPVAVEKEEGEELAVTVLHIDNDTQAEDVTLDSVEDENGGLKEVSFETSSFSPIVIIPMNKTRQQVPEYDGDYTLEYILNNFNIFIRNNFSGIHLIGAIAVGNDAVLNQAWSNNGYGSIGNLYYGHPVSSYVKGDFKVADFTTGSGVPLILGSSSSTPRTGDYGTIYRSDDYIDFDQAFEMLQNQVESVEADVVITDEEINTLQSKDTNLYTIVSSPEAGNGVQINIKQDNKSYAFSGKSKVKVVNFEGKTTPASIEDIKIIVTDSGTAQIPIMRLNGQEMGPLTGLNGEWSSEGTGLAWLYPNADKVVGVRSGLNTVGAIAAPKADVFLNGGNYNGSIIAKSLETSAEGHMWPYRGSEFGTTSTTESTSSTTTTESTSSSTSTTEDTSSSTSTTEDTSSSTSTTESTSGSTSTTERTSGSTSTTESTSGSTSTTEGTTGTTATRETTVSTSVTTTTEGASSTESTTRITVTEPTTETTTDATTTTRRSGGGGSGGSGGPRGNTPSGNGGPGVTIEDTPVPLAEFPENMDLQVIEEMEVPLAQLPKTGQRTSAYLWSLLSSLTLLAGISLIHKKEE